MWTDATFFEWFIDVFRNLDAHLALWTSELGAWVYVILFTIIFCETGLVVTPFLPGDSLLFATGAVIALDGSPLNLALMLGLLIVAAVLGDAVNYGVGLRLGPKVFHSDQGRFLNKRHLAKAHAFYEKHGGKTIVIARFIPIIRTFAPFVAGVGKMGYRRFALFNVSGGVAWVLTFVVAGYYFGNLPIVKRNFQLVIIGIIVVSILPGVIELIRHRRAAKNEARQAKAAEARSDG
jgi:membrane-associated protein